MHCLVIVYQSLTGNYSQPIETFASIKPVAGEELCKIIIKAVCLLEKAGALIHGCYRGWYQHDSQDANDFWYYKSS